MGLRLLVGLDALAHPDGVVGIDQISTVGLRRKVAIRDGRVRQNHVGPELPRSVWWDCDVLVMSNSPRFSIPSSKVPRSVRWDCDTRAMFAAAVVALAVFDGIDQTSTVGLRP